MKFFAKFVSVLALLLSSTAYSADDRNIEESIKRLDDLSQSELGLSLHAVSYLITLDPYSFIPKNYLEESGEMEVIRELEESGYAVIREITGLPDASAQDEVFINVVTSYHGKELLRCIQDMKGDGT